MIIEIYPRCGHELEWIGCFADTKDAYNIVVDRINDIQAEF